jgi:serine/threonine-protein kinase HipA
MISTAFVNLWGERVGAIAWDSGNGLGSFEFEPKFLNSGLDISPILMPANNAKNRIFTFNENRDSLTFRGLPGLLADILPDTYGNALINSWLVTQGRPSDSLNPVEILCFINKRAMGALEIEPALRNESSRSSKVEIDSLIDIANKILTNKESFQTRLSQEDESALAEILKIGTSAAGARAKAVIAYNPKTNEIRSGQVDTPKGFYHWLIKSDGVTDDQFGTSHGYGRVEMAYHLMAKDAGIDMMECRLFEENNRAHFMTKRFDRLDNNEKVHMQSLCALRHYDFNLIGVYSYELAFETMRMLRLSYPEAEEMFRRMVFNVLARNCDDHTKNFAFLMDKNGKWKLSPAFDVCYAYRPESEWVSQQSMTINGKRDNITKVDFLTVGRNMNIKRAKQIIEEVNNAIKNWRNYADQMNVDIQLRDAIGKTLIEI